VSAHHSQGAQAPGFPFFPTPPVRYCLKFQPIELIWGASKHRALGMWFSRRNMEATRMHLRMGFYGGAFQGNSLSPLNVAGCYRKARGGDE
jgi:hypothetical protein